jgi:hypothetical protein
MSSIKLGSREIKLPKSRLGRIAIGVTLLFGGLLWFLPVVGIWMIPLGIMVLAIDIAAFRRLSQRMSDWWNRRGRK